MDKAPAQEGDFDFDFDLNEPLNGGDPFADTLNFIQKSNNTQGPSEPAPEILRPPASYDSEIEYSQDEEPNPQEPAIETLPVPKREPSVALEEEAPKPAEAKRKKTKPVTSSLGSSSSSEVPAAEEPVPTKEKQKKKAPAKKTKVKAKPPKPKASQTASQSSSQKKGKPASQTASQKKNAKKRKRKNTSSSEDSDSSSESSHSQPFKKKKTEEEENEDFYELHDPDQYLHIRPPINFLVRAKDKDGRWYNAVILTSDGDKIKVRFEGWGPGNDEWIKITSTTRFRPFLGGIRDKGARSAQFPRSYDGKYVWPAAYLDRTEKAVDTDSEGSSDTEMGDAT